VVKEHKQYLSAEDQALMDTIPNKYLGVVYRLTEGMRKAYGANENGDAHTQKSGVQVSVDIEAERKDLRKQMNELETRPHSALEKQTLVDKLDATYRNK
jgi:hypothetical protein